MGGALVTQEPKRYMGGKIPSKYFIEDVWPDVSELFLKLNITQHKGLAIFKAFVDIDTDESGTVEHEECVKFFGGPRNKFTERFFYMEQEDPRNPVGQAFEPWVIEIWNFLSLDYAQVARLVFEIFDIERKGVLERADVESIYRMLYDCDDADDYYVGQLPFDGAQQISKAEFSKHCAKNRHIIQPALNYQRRLRRRIGGNALWEGLSGFRRRYFQAQDTGNFTLAEAGEVIITMEDPSRKRRKMAAEALLKEQAAKLGYEQEMAEREARQREKQMQREQKMATRSAELVRMKKCWKEFQHKKKEFQEAEYTTEDIWMRREHRLELFRLLDVWNEAAAKHWAKHDKAVLDTAMGTEEDHIMRYSDFLNTSEGINMKNAVMMKLLFEDLRAKGEAEKAKAKQKSGKNAMSGDKMTIRDVEIKTCIEDLTTFIENFDVPEAQEDGPAKFGVKKRHVKHKGDKDALARETAILAKYTKPAELLQYNNKADEFLRENRREALNKLTQSSLENAKTEREKDYIRQEFEIASSFGSRITRWEFVFNTITEKMVYLNVDTLEMIHRNSSICEKCDSLIEQFDMVCQTCKFPRSAKNLRLYRPLGTKDIRVD